MDDPTEGGRWLSLRRVGLGSTNFALLLRAFGSIRAAWEAGAEDLSAAGLDATYVRAVDRARRTGDPAGELELVERAGATVVTWRDAAYPALLRQVPQSPPLLVVRGSAGPALPLAVAVVGTRRVSAYGRRVAEEFTAAFCEAGIGIVSGLARGVDAVAHRVALEHGVPTVAVLAGGIDEIYPREHEGLVERLVDCGCVVSEYPPGTPARPDYFPRRNRILSGLARATLVVEAGAGSGALHTANWAFEQGRDVFAVPGSVFSRQSAGTHALIRDTVATLVTGPGQVLAELGLMEPSGQYPMGASTPRADAGPDRDPEERLVLACLEPGPRHVDDIGRATGLAADRLSAVLTVLEIDGLVRPAGPMTFELPRRGRA